MSIHTEISIYSRNMCIRRVWESMTPIPGHRSFRVPAGSLFMSPAATQPSRRSLRRAVQVCRKVLLFIPDSLYLRANGLNGLNGGHIVGEVFHGLVEVFVCRIEVVDPDVSDLARRLPDTLHGGLDLVPSIPDISDSGSQAGVLHALKRCSEVSKILAELRLRLLLRRLDASGTGAGQDKDQRDE